MSVNVRVGITEYSVSLWGITGVLSIVYFSDLYDRPCALNPDFMGQQFGVFFLVIDEIKRGEKVEDYIL